MLTDKETVDTIDGQHTNRIYTRMEVTGQRIQFQLATGATCKVLRKADLSTVENPKETRQIRSLYDGTTITPIGKCQVMVRNPKNGRSYLTQFVVVEKAPVAILEQKLCNKCNYYIYTQMVSTQQKKAPQAAKDKISGLTKQDIVNKYPEVFQREVGRLEGKLKLEVDDMVKAVRLQVRRIPLSVKAELKKELDRLEKMEIIQREYKPTDWISSLIVAHKPNGKLRNLHLSEASE